MKKTLLLTLLALLGMTHAVAQEYEYVPFVREGVKWVYCINDYHFFKDYETNPARGDNNIYRTLELRGDTVINGKTYKAMHKCTDDFYSEPTDVVPIYLREEDKKVYGIVPDGKFYDDAIISNSPFDISADNVIYSGEEFLLYDFQDPMNVFENDWYDINLQVDTIMVGGQLAKRYYYGEGVGGDFQIIEGIGATGMNSYPLAFLMPIGTGVHTTEYYSLEKVIENGEIIYPQGFVEDRYLPVIREGVKWVNERVTVNNGDTTCSYYTYEFKGNHPDKNGYGYMFKALYRYDGRHHELDIDNDSLIAGLREDEAAIMDFKNKLLDNVINENRNLIDFNYVYYHNNENRLMYEMGTYYNKMFAIEFYILTQREQFLNTENFVMVDPMVIDGVTCSRCAYIGEQGDTLAYVVEGIGFDSRDLGDLLTPFTRKPDPDADYQEWCGLSHVIKNGQIIYKGMRYRDGADGIDEVVADKMRRPLDPNYYNLMGQPVGKDVPTTPGIYIHHGNKIIIR